MLLLIAGVHVIRSVVSTRQRLDGQRLDGPTEGMGRDALRLANRMVAETMWMPRQQLNRHELLPLPQSRQQRNS